VRNIGAKKRLDDLGAKGREYRQVVAMGGIAPERNELNVQIYVFWCIWQAEKGKSAANVNEKLPVCQCSVAIHSL